MVACRERVGQRDFHGNNLLTVIFLACRRSTSLPFKVRLPRGGPSSPCHRRRRRRRLHTLARPSPATQDDPSRLLILESNAGIPSRARVFRWRTKSGDYRIARDFRANCCKKKNVARYDDGYGIGF